MTINRLSRIDTRRTFIDLKVLDVRVDKHRPKNGRRVAKVRVGGRGVKTAVQRYPGLRVEKIAAVVVLDIHHDAGAHLLEITQATAAPGILPRPAKDRKEDSG